MFWEPLYIEPGYSTWASQSVINEKGATSKETILHLFWSFPYTQRLREGLKTTLVERVLITSIVVNIEEVSLSYRPLIPKVHKNLI